jgi:hypothetical protein
VSARAAKIAKRSSGALSSDAGDSIAGSAASSDLRDLAFMMPPKRQKAFNDRIVRWFICTMTPAQRIGHPEFLAACAEVGATPPTRKEAYDQYLPRIYETVERALATVKAMKMYMIAIVGWKKRSAGKGSPLVNVLLLDPKGGSVFWK